MESRKDRSSSPMEINDGWGTYREYCRSEVGISKPWFRCERSGTRRGVDFRPWRLRALGLLRQQVELVRHSAEFRERCGFDLAQRAQGLVVLAACAVSREPHV